MLKEIKIEVTDLCDRFCKHCSSNATYKRDNYQSLSCVLVYRIIDEASQMGVESIAFTGGEATLWPYLIDAIKYATNKGIETKLYTMCYRTDSNLELLEQLVNNGLSEIIYSTTADDLAVEDTISIYSIVSFMEKLQSRVDFKLSFHHVITAETLTKIDDVCHIYDELSTNSKFKGKIGFLRFVPHGRGTMDLILNKKQWYNFRNKIIQLREKYGDNHIKIGSPHNPLCISHSECTAADETMIIGFNGEAYPCDAMKYFEAVGLGGNIYEKSLIDIYNSLYFKKVRNVKVYVSEQCKKCNGFTICKGGCLGQKIIYCFNPDRLKTFEWYQTNAKRSMNNFNNEEMIINAEMGLSGETGALIDDLKREYTHSLTAEYKALLRDKMATKVGDIIWYIAAPLCSQYNLTLDEIVDNILNKPPQGPYLLCDNDLVKHCAKQPDPICIKDYNRGKNKIVDFDKYIEDQDQAFDPKTKWKEIDDMSYLLRNTDGSREEVIKRAGALLITLTRFSHRHLGVSLQEVLTQNVIKLQKRYPTGFNDEVANRRVKREIEQKLSEEVKPKTLVLN